MEGVASVKGMGWTTVNGVDVDGRNFLWLLDFD